MAGDGVLSESKVSTTPDDPSRAVVAGVAALLEELDLDPARVEEVLHGTTVGSNTLLQRSGARTGLITTRGFRDVLEIGRIRMPDMFDLTWDKPKPLVPRRHRLEVAERIAADGSVVEPLDEASVVAAAQQLSEAGIEVDRHLPHQQLPQPRPRAAHRGDPARTLPAPAGLRLLGRAARAQGVRAHQHHGGQRLPALGHAHLSPKPGKRARLHRHQGADPASSPPTAACSRPPAPARSRCSWWHRALPAA